MLGRTAIVFICDCDFIVPTLGAARAARIHTSDGTIEILVFLLANSIDHSHSEIIDRLGPLAAEYGISLKLAEMEQLSEVNPATYKKTHVPMSALARLWLDALLAPEIDKFLYLDGDIDITGSLDGLLRSPLPQNGFLAAPDLPFLIDSDKGNASQRIRTYLRGLGVRRADQYFNSGVLWIDRAGWRSIGLAAWNFFQAHPERCICYDQSALNAVAGSSRARLSLLWNYQTDFMAVADPRDWGYEPHIWHFTQFPKPWHACAFPWGNEFGQSFRLGQELVASGHMPVVTSPDHQKVIKGVAARNKLAHRLKWVYPWRRWLRSSRIKADLQAYPKVTERTFDPTF